MYQDEKLICEDCGAEFIFTQGEQEFSRSPMRCMKKRPELQVLLEVLGQIGGIDGDGNGDVDIGVADDLLQIGDELLQIGQQQSHVSLLVAEDLTGTVDEQIGDVAVTGQDAGDHAAQSDTALNEVIVGIDETNFITDFMTQGSALLNAHYVALGGLQSLIYGCNQGFGLTGTLYANKQFDHI